MTYADSAENTKALSRLEQVVLIVLLVVGSITFFCSVILKIGWMLNLGLPFWIGMVAFGFYLVHTKPPEKLP